jgi:hypothetical protein
MQTTFAIPVGDGGIGRSATGAVCDLLAGPAAGTQQERQGRDDEQKRKREASGALPRRVADGGLILCVTGHNSFLLKCLSENLPRNEVFARNFVPFTLGKRFVG